MSKIQKSYAAAECRAMLGPHPARIRGFQGWRYRWWLPGLEIPFPNWQREGVPDYLLADPDAAIERIAR